MFKHILITIILIIITYYIIKYTLVATHTLYTDKLKIKYPLHNRDLEYMLKYSTPKDIFDYKENEIFYTTKLWSTKNNNYLQFNERYYIIEPGYYYYIQPGVKLFLNNNCKINCLNKNTGSFIKNLYV
jgi:hypothetical protein